MIRIKCFFLEFTGRYSDPREINNVDAEIIGTGSDPIYRRIDTGEEIIGLHSAPVGAVWFADWYGKRWNPQREFSLIVKTPGGDWHVDGQSSNCTMPHDVFQKEHHCWIIEGSPENIETLTVSKNGATCEAGAGSILIGTYHGFLRHGYLEEC